MKVTSLFFARICVACLICTYVGHVSKVSPNRILFIILQHNINVIKVECDADVQSEEGSPEMKTDDVCIPSPFAVYIAEPQVILILG
jgi:hypothetical protein